MIPKAWLKGRKMPSEDIGNNKVLAIMTTVISICVVVFLTNMISCVESLEENNKIKHNNRLKAFEVCVSMGNGPERCKISIMGN